MDKKELIMRRLGEHYLYLREKGYEVVCLMLQGSQNYDLDEYSENYQSDIDSKAIVLPHFRDVVYEKMPVSYVEILPNNEHIDVKDIRVMFEMFKKENLSYIELLYTPYLIINPKYADLIAPIFQFREDIASWDCRQFLKCILGMSGNKVKALCHPYPNLIDKIEKYGYDGKQLSHCARLYEFTIKYLLGFPLEECYICKRLKTACMNYKKQLTAAGDRILTQEEAIKLCDYYYNETEKLIKEHLEDFEEADAAALEWLNEVKYNCLKRKFLEDLYED